MVDLTSIIVEVALTQARMDAVSGVSPKSEGTSIS
jgi:hypothetical protein